MTLCMRTHTTHIHTHLQTHTHTYRHIHTKGKTNNDWRSVQLNVSSDFSLGSGILLLLIFLVLLACGIQNLHQKKLVFFHKIRKIQVSEKEEYVTPFIIKSSLHPEMVELVHVICVFLHESTLFFRYLNLSLSCIRRII